MTPITEDQVVALMDGFAAREKDSIKACQDDATASEIAEKPVSASILRFARKADVVELNAPKKTPAPRRTVSGMFFYSSRTTAPA